MLPAARKVREQEPSSPEHKIRVTLLSSEWCSKKGGISTLNRELAKQLAKHPLVEVTLFITQCSEEEKREAVSNNINVVIATKQPGLEEHVWLCFPPDDLQIDTVIGHGAVLGPQAKIISENRNCTWIQVVHTSPKELGMFKTYPHPISKSEIKHQIEVQLCELAHLVVAVGPKLREAFQSYLRWCKNSPNHVVNLTPGIFDEYLDIEHVSRQDATKCRVLVFGRGDKEDFELKGYDIAAKAVAELSNTTLIFAGAHDTDHLKDKFLNNGISPEDLDVRGFMNKDGLTKLFDEVDLVIMPSRTEGFGLSALEALSAGLPVLVSHNTGFGEALSKITFGTSCIIDSKDPSVWAKAIKQVWDKSMKTRLKEFDFLRTQYRQEYNWEEQCSEIVEKMMAIRHARGGLVTTQSLVNSKTSKPSSVRNVITNHKVCLKSRKQPAVSAESKNSVSKEKHATARPEEKSSQTESVSNELEKTLRGEFAQMRQMLIEEIHFREAREREFREKDKTVEQLHKALTQTEKERDKVGKKLSQARTAFRELVQRFQTEKVQMRQNRDNEICLRQTKELELQEKETVLEELREALDEEQQAKSRVEEELSQVRSECSELEEQLHTERRTNKSHKKGQRRLLEEERQQKRTLEDRLRNLELQMEEERERNVFTERSLRSAREELREHQSLQPPDWVIQREEISLNENVLGQGAWGIVHEGTFRGCQVAIKELHEVILSPHNIRLFEREMNIAWCCRHPNLLQFIGATNDDASPLFVTELLDMTLRQFINYRALNPDEIINLSLDVARGLNYLHLNRRIPIVHRDISSANVLLWRRDNCWRAKLSDYGSANFVRQIMTMAPGAMIYAPPEARTLNAQQSTKVDVYSFGVLLCEMCIRELPDPEDRHKQIRRVTEKTLRRLIRRCVEIDPEARPATCAIIRELERPTKVSRTVSRVRSFFRKSVNRKTCKPK